MATRRKQAPPRPDALSSRALTLRALDLGGARGGEGFGRYPAGVFKSPRYMTVLHAKTPAQLDREIAQALERAGDRKFTEALPTTMIKLKDRDRGHVTLTIRDGVVIGAGGSDPRRFMGKTLARAKHIARHGGG